MTLKINIECKLVHTDIEVINAEGLRASVKGSPKHISHLQKGKTSYSYLRIYCPLFHHYWLYPDGNNGTYWYWHCLVMRQCYYHARHSPLLQEISFLLFEWKQCQAAILLIKK